MSRGWMELLVVGDTRTGKSEAATRLTQFYGAGEVVSCESASFAGILGGLQQFGANKEWAVTWGAIPINDRRLVVLDEISGLSPEDIGAMSSSGRRGRRTHQDPAGADLREDTADLAREPAQRTDDDYTYGVQAIRR
jgi:hypothetical protein